MSRRKDNTIAPAPWGGPERASWWAILVVAGLWAASRSASSGDLWVSLGCGRFILAHGVGGTDPFSFTSPPGSWVNQNWLSHVLLTWIHAAAGLSGLGVWKAVVCTAILWLVTSIARALGAGRPAALLAAIGTAVACRPFFDIRPNLHTVLLAAILLRWIVGIERRSLRAYGLPVLLMILWANLHGGFLFGILALGVAAAVALARRSARPRVLLLPLTAIAASLVSPYGVTNLTHPWAITAGPAAAHWRGVAEWRPSYGPGVLAAPGVLPFWILAAVGGITTILGAAIRRTDSAQGRDVLPLAGVALAAFGLTVTSRRFAPLFAVAAIPPIAAVLADRIRLPRLPRLAYPAAAVVLVSLAGIDIVHRLFVPNALWARDVGWAQRLVRADEQPAEAVRFLLGTGARGRLFTDWTWGGYLLWADPFTAGVPRYRIYIDGRAQAAYPVSVSEDLLALDRAAAAGKVDQVREFLDRHGIEIALLDRRGPGLAAVVPGLSGWVGIYGDDKSLLAVREGLAPSLSPGPFPEEAIADASEALRLRTGGLNDPGQSRSAFELALRSVQIRPTTFGVTEMTRIALMTAAPLGPELRARAADACRLVLATDLDRATYRALTTRANTAQCASTLARSAGDAASAQRLHAEALALSDRAERIVPRYLR